ncbi:hypothetical protein CBFG_06245 [Clostridiales bacterium 1_7_47FAA]|nr:hypothetical protein CBFG_06245 [Clostridiales bacterium 1_7_47FAA]
MSRALPWCCKDEQGVALVHVAQCQEGKGSRIKWLSNVTNFHLILGM